MEGSGATVPDAWVAVSADVGRVPTRVQLAEGQNRRLASGALRRRVALAAGRNRTLLEELGRQRLLVRQQRHQLQARMQESLRERAAARLLRAGCERGQRPVARPDTERLLRLHAEYAATGRPDFRTELLAAYDGLALGLARRFPSRREAPEDLAQVARIGLLHALDRFDPDRGRPFVAFARATIGGELKRHVRDRTWSMRIPRSLQEQYLIVVRTLDDLTQELGRSPRIAELAARAGLSEEQVLEAMELGVAQHPVSLDVPASDADGPALDPGLADGGFGAVEGRDLLSSLLSRLSERERQVLRMRFVDELTQADIAKQIGVSQMYVSRLLARSLARLRGLTSELA